MLTPTNIYDLGRDAYIIGVHKRVQPFAHSASRVLWNRGVIQERNDLLDVVNAMKKGASQ